MTTEDIEGVEWREFTRVKWWECGVMGMEDGEEKEELKAVLSNICEDAARMLRDAFKRTVGFYRDEWDVWCGKDFIGGVIGTFEQNCIGVRVRHPSLIKGWEGGDLGALERRVKRLYEEGLTGPGDYDDDEDEEDEEDEEEAEEEEENSVPPPPPPPIPPPHIPLPVHPAATPTNLNPPLILPPDNPLNISNPLGLLRPPPRRDSFILSRLQNEPLLHPQRNGPV
eukprot:CAMPEP_0118631972 /NCGR_PEP_ID=MMETSP0785-20121206/191_1 /TAXON_ID=91992 /ORGANISM="Bolidomonas pacifica, Strain CCMP 1866" /LENGTH=224 /DNA_ID=CAMNT_0006522701 /DNA_START=531 /DNA_END=1206 /DNA_ORIENTATION=+